MRTYHTDYDLDRYPALARATRLGAALVVVGTLAAAAATAGPGNGALPREQWSPLHRPEVVRVHLPKVTVVGRVGEPQSVASITCAKGA